MSAAAAAAGKNAPHLCVSAFGLTGSAMGHGIRRARQWGIGRLLSTGAAGDTSGQRNVTDQLFDVHKMLANSQKEFYKEINETNKKIAEASKEYHQRSTDSERFTHRSLTLVRRVPS
jgi:hypothetical protein